MSTDLHSEAAPMGAGSTETGLELTILMPCLNESETLGRCIAKAQEFLRTSGVAGEIVIADNGSSDGSQEIARSLGCRVVHVPVRGYGAALYHGSLQARGRYVIMGDSDDSYDFLHLGPFVEKLREGYDLVMGNRFRGGILPGAMPWKNRYLGNPILSGIGRLFFHCPAGDFHCGMRGYSMEAFRKLDLRTTGMEYASEMVIKATLFRMRICEVPTTLSPDGRSRPPHLRPWRDGWRHLRFMLLYSPRWLFLYPGFFLVALGAVLGALVWGGPANLFGVHLDIHTLAYAAGMILLGFQSILFAVLTKVFAIQEGLLPPDRRFKRMFKYISLEVGLIVAVLFVGIGFWQFWRALRIWQSHDFGGLDPSQTMRLVIPSILLMALGTQIIFNSFFLSILGMRTRKLPPLPELPGPKRLD